MDLKQLTPRVPTWSDRDDCTLTSWVKVRPGLIRGRTARMRRSNLIALAIEGGLVAMPHRCDCSICRADADCCGEMVPGHVTVKRGKGRTYRLSQTYFRNN